MRQILLWLCCSPIIGSRRKYICCLWCQSTYCIFTIISTGGQHSHSYRGNPRPLADNTTATRRLERQRRGEVPSLAHGFVDITSNYYTGYYTTCKKRFSSSTNNRLDNAKRLRRSEVTSVSNVDVDDEMQGSEGFANVVDSDEEASPPNNLSDDIREQVEISELGEGCYETP